VYLPLTKQIGPCDMHFCFCRCLKPIMGHRDEGHVALPPWQTQMPTPNAHAHAFAHAFAHAHKATQHKATQHEVATMKILAAAAAPPGGLWTELGVCLVGERTPNGALTVPRATVCLVSQGGRCNPPRAQQRRFCRMWEIISWSRATPTRGFEGQVVIRWWLSRLGDQRVHAPLDKSPSRVLLFASGRQHLHGLR
jgi:hypothetical protein